LTSGSEFVSTLICSQHSAEEENMCDISVFHLVAELWLLEFRFWVHELKNDARFSTLNTCISAMQHQKSLQSTFLDRAHFGLRNKYKNDFDLIFSICTVAKNIHFRMLVTWEMQ
jgi:hypothetical protein